MSRCCSSPTSLLCLIVLAALGCREDDDVELSSVPRPSTTIDSIDASEGASNGVPIAPVSLTTVPESKTKAIPRAEQPSDPNDRSSSRDRSTTVRIDSGIVLPWTTSRVRGTPEPAPPYAVEPAFPDLILEEPVVITAVPSTERLVVAQTNGQVVTFAHDSDSQAVDVALDLSSERPGFNRLFGLAFHPDYARNGRIYLCYTVGRKVDDGTRVSEFRTNLADPPQIDPSSERVLLTWYAGGHNGGCLKFGPIDGYLYISAGDGADPTPPDPFKAGQDLSTLLSKIMRIDVDQRDPDRQYRVPSDNPFVDRPKARPEIWAYGFRNPWRMSFDRLTGNLWVGDVGWELWEMVHRVEGGGNYGWSLTEAGQPVRSDIEPGPTPIIPPVVRHPHSEAASMTGGFVYRGSRLPELRGMYIYGDYQVGTIWGLRYEAGEVTEHRVLAETPIRLSAFGEDSDGEIYLLDYQRTNQVYRLIRNESRGDKNAAPFPRRLSETGLFRSTARHEPEAGVIPYAINATIWEDHAEVERLMALPESHAITFKENRLWEFPEGAVLTRTISRQLRAGDPSSRRRLETQMLHFEGGSWRPYTYAWNAEQTDAELIDADGGERIWTFNDPLTPNGQRTITTRYAARSECVLCHNPWAGEGLLFGRQSATPLTANTLQLHTNVEVDGKVVEQLARFQDLGVFNESFPDTPASTWNRLVDPHDFDQPLEARARSYLAANCSHCHRFGAGGSASIFLTFDKANDQMNALGVAPMQGSFKIDGARIIDPGSPVTSTLYYRMAKLGSGRMPRVGVHKVDVEGLDLIYNWIAQLDAEGQSIADLPADDHRLEWGRLDPSTLDALERLSDPRLLDTQPGTSNNTLNRILEDVGGALALLRMIDQGEVDEAVVEAILDRMGEGGRTEVRDLFERFVPKEHRVARLGRQIDVQELLEVNGDPDQGRALYFEGSELTCRDCHRVGGQGREVGPDLDRIASKYRRDQILHHILNPSDVVDQKYRNYAVETWSGRFYSGLLIEDSEESLVLRNVQGEAIRIPREDVDRSAPLNQSIMPEGLLQDLTAEQAADLLAFLATLK